MQFFSFDTLMRSNSEAIVQQAQRVHYARVRQFSRLMSHILAGMFILWGLWFLVHTYEDPTFAPMLVIYIPIAVYTTIYSYALTDTCVITSETGIEYRRPEFSILATWSQIKSLQHNALLPMLGLRYYLILESPTILYTKWFGTAYKFQLNPILFPGWQKRLPLGKMWQAYEELENEIRTQVPSLSFESSRAKVAG